MLSPAGETSRQRDLEPVGVPGRLDVPGRRASDSDRPRGARRAGIIVACDRYLSRQHPLRSTLFPYTTLFRSEIGPRAGDREAEPRVETRPAVIGKGAGDRGPGAVAQ